MIKGGQDCKKMRIIEMLNRLLGQLQMFKTAIFHAMNIHPKSNPQHNTHELETNDRHTCLFIILFCKIM